MGRWVASVALALAALHADTARADDDLNALALIAQLERELPRTRYELRAEIDGDTLHGSGVIRVVNHADVPLHDLVLHLYANAFASEKTVFAREGGLRLRGVPFERAGGILLTRLEDEWRRDLLATAQPELVPDDRTQLRVTLSEPLAPGKAHAFRVAFTLRFPSLVARMGRSRDFYMVAQWFPKLARLERDGRWRSGPYHGSAEFDEDFADYDVRVDAHAGSVIAAPGERHAQTFRLTRARDFAFAVAPELVIARARSRHVEVEAYAPRGYHALAARHAGQTAHWLDRLEDALGRYPYERLVIVVPPAYARGGEGMEYAGLFVSATASAWSGLLPAWSDHDFTSAHELAHQWFPMLTSNDEVRSPVLDEGLAQWLCMHLMRHDYSRDVFARITGVRFDPFDVLAAQLALRERDVPSSLSAANAIERRYLADAMYTRPALVLETLAAQHGERRVLRALGGYARKHRFAHVELADFDRALDAEYGTGFAENELRPLLGGRSRVTEAFARARQAEPTPSSALASRVLAFAQHLLGWLGP